MRFSVVLRYVGMMMLCLAAVMLLSAGVSLYYDMDTSFYPLLLSALLTAFLGAFPLCFVERSEQINSKEGFCIVVGAWIAACVVGMFPYLIWGGEFTLANAWFESVSGFTTTGATILSDIEALPNGLLFWRTSTNWLGGVGVVMFALVILPSLGKTKMMLSNVELSSLAKDNYHYRTPVIVRILLVVYLGLTVVGTIALKIAGMNWFDALNHSMSACATGGFSTKNASIAFFDSPAIEVITICLMAISGIHFGLIYATLLCKRNNIFRSEVTRTYFAVIGASIVCIMASLMLSGIYPNFFTSLRQAAFNVVSIITSTGFATVDTNLWTPFAIIVLVMLSLVCSCAGSTSGGIKIDRLLLFVKSLGVRIKRQQHPHAIIRIKVDGVMQEDDTVHTVMVYIATYMSLILGASLITSMFGFDLRTSCSSAVACMGNVGPGFGQVGAVANYGIMPVAVKFLDTILMLLGRLEIFGFIQLFFFRWWR